ncbi:hypothetical protein [Roseateles noduli]|uniref:hypothetical protein n=1 Tax=Roseateles noduli TaxID=2052484 RepID=UPI003D6485C6
MPNPASRNDDASSSSLQSPKALVALLTQCRHDPLRRVACAFVPGASNKPDLFVVHARLNGRKLLAELCAEAGAKGGSAGEAWLEEDVLMLKLDKPSAGVEKKVLAAVKRHGFRIERVTLAGDETSPRSDNVDPSSAFKARPGALMSEPRAMAPTNEVGVDWVDQRAGVLKVLRAAASQIAAARHARSAAAIIEIQAIVGKLGGEPSTFEQIDHLQGWLDSDDVVQDVCDLCEDIRTPLLQSLNGLRSRIASR